MVQLFSTHRGSEYLPSTLPTFNGTLYWSVTHDTNASAVLIKASNAIFSPAIFVVTVTVLTVPLGREHRCRARSHDIYITVPSRSQRESYDDQWSVERKQHAHDPKRCRSCDLFHGLCTGLQLHRPRIQRQRRDCLYSVISLHNVLVIKRISFFRDKYFSSQEKLHVHPIILVMIIQRVSNCPSLCPSME